MINSGSLEILTSMAQSWSLDSQIEKKETSRNDGRKAEARKQPHIFRSASYPVCHNNS